MKIFVINLEKDKDRFQSIKNKLDKLSLKFTRIEAVDGRLLSEPEYIDFCKRSPRNREGISWTKGQIGCFLSHFNAWKQIASGNDEFAVILEDDVHLSDDISKVLGDFHWIPSDTDIIRLEAPSNRVLLDMKDAIEINNEQAYRLRTTAWCTGGYILSKKTAFKLISADEMTYQPTDFYMFSKEHSYFFSDFKIYQFLPALCLQNKFTDNVIFDSNTLEPNSTKRKLSFTSAKSINLRLFFEKVFKTFQGYKKIHSKES